MERLNHIIGNFVNDYQIEDFRELSFISTLTHMINDHPLKLKDVYARKKVPIHKSFQYTYEFLRSIDERYGEHLLQLKEQKVFDIVINSQDAPYSTLQNGKSYIYLPINYNIGDTYSITHETIHDLSIEENSLTRYLFLETFSLLGEMLQKDYFERTSRPKEYKLNNLTMLRGLYSKTRSILLELDLLQTYLDYGYIDQLKLLNILDHFSESELIETINNLSQIVITNELNYGFEQRYIIGYLIASYMHSRILDDPKKIKEFVELNDSLGEYDLSDFLDYLDLEYEHSRILNLTPKSYQKLQTSFVQELKRR